MKDPNGVVIYDGPSQLDNKTPIIVVMTGLKIASRND